MILDEIVRSAISRAGVVRVRSALNPFLWMIAWSAIFGALTFILKDDTVLKYISFGLAALPELVALGIGIAFAIRSPDRLQSEEFVIRQQELKVLYAKGEQPEIVDISPGDERVLQSDHKREIGDGG